MEHDWLHRTRKLFPERGRIGVFNRSYYEETLVVRVHPQYLRSYGLQGMYNGFDITMTHHFPVLCHPTPRRPVTFNV